MENPVPKVVEKADANLILEQLPGEIVDAGLADSPAKVRARYL